MKQIGLVPELVVMNIEKSLNFYAGVLGFEIVFRREEQDFAYIKKGNAEIMLEQPGKSRVWKTGEFKYPLGIGVNFSIEVHDVVVLYEKINKLGLLVFLPLEEKWYNQNTKMVGNKQFIIQDPDGYLLRFFQDMGVKDLTENPISDSKEQL